ncbi:MAG: serine/threonine-protein kinase [Myxococcota bacterium]|nr:serine/threonine-protein kinase [Myxococcota bacterium]
MSSERLPRLGRYQVLSKIAEGGMAEIFLAKAIGVMGFERLAAIKLIRPHLMEDSDFVKMFLDEARIAMHLRHRNIVQTTELERVDGTYFIAMEFVHGVNVYDLYERIAAQGQWIELPMALYIVSEACKGLHFAHMRTHPDGRPLGIIHRDISPQNILLSFEGEVKIMDFGIAQATDRLHKTQPGIVKGKYQYMAPEILQDRKVDHRIDVFAAGVVLYELLTRENPFAGATAVETIESVLRKPVIPPTEKCGVGSRALDSIILKALAKDPDERYSSARELSAVLTDHGLGLTGARWDIASGDSSLAQLLQSLFPDKIAQTFTPSSAEEVVLPRAHHYTDSQVDLSVADTNDEQLILTVDGSGANVSPLDVTSLTPSIEAHDDEDEVQTALALDADPYSEESKEPTTHTALEEPVTDRALEAIHDEKDASGGVTILDQGADLEALRNEYNSESANALLDRGPTVAPKRKADQRPVRYDAPPLQKERGVTEESLITPVSASNPDFYNSQASLRASRVARTVSNQQYVDVKIPAARQANITTGVEHNQAPKHSELTRAAFVMLALSCIVLAIVVFYQPNREILTIPIHSEPQGATVVINGVVQENRTPLSALVPSGRTYRVEISAPGFRTFSKEFYAKGDSRIKIDAILTAK